MSEMPKVDEAKIDILRELANIGVGNATISLSQLLNQERVRMDVPEVNVAPLQDVPELLGGAEKPVGGIYVEAEGELSLIILFVLSLGSAGKLIGALIPGHPGELDEMGRSALLEVGNIITGSYLNALSSMTGTTFTPAPPALAVDMAGAILATVLAEARMVDDYLLLLKTFLHTEATQIDGAVLILPDHGSLGKIFRLLGENQE